MKTSSEQPSTPEKRLDGLYKRRNIQKKDVATGRAIRVLIHLVFIPIICYMWIPTIAERVMNPGTSESAVPPSYWPRTKSRAVAKVIFVEDTFGYRGKISHMEPTSPTTPTPEDKQRVLAEMKKLTLQPLHGNVAPEEASDEELAARHANGPAIGNASNDTEQNAAPVRPSKSALATASPLAQHGGARRYIFTSVAIVAILGGIVLSMTFLFA